MNRSKILLPLLALPLLGLGCFQVGPRIVRAPERPTVADGRTVSGQNEAGDAGMPVAQTTALAYLRVDQGAAAVIRGGARFEGSDAIELLAGDEIEVTDGAVSLVYPDAGESRLEEGSHVVLLPQQENTKSGDVATEVQLLAGQIWTRFERLLGPQEKFSVVGNGVVATVRGTAFGVSLETDGAVDVQVADHEVEVASQEDQEAQISVSGTAALPPSKVVKLMAGEALKATAKQIKASEKQLQKLVRKLTEKEKGSEGYAFGAKRLPLQRIRKPFQPVRLQGQASIPAAYQNRFEVLKKEWKLRFEGPKNAPNFIIPNLNQTAPNVDGPTQ